MEIYFPSDFFSALIRVLIRVFPRASISIEANQVSTGSIQYSLNDFPRNCPSKTGLNFDRVSPI